jgi:AraC-like DNA-binding protein
MCSLAEQQLPNPIFFDEDFKKYAEAIRRGKEYINDNLSHKLLLDDIARAAYISPFHFLRIFKRFTGITLHQYVLSLRIERAKSFFRQQLSIAETFNRLGFSNQVHFTRVFKKMTGLTPMQYKRIMNPGGLPCTV